MKKRNKKYMLKIIFVDKDERKVDALRGAFRDLPNFEFRRQNIIDIAADVIVSAGNSKAQMDGGVDKPINYSLNYISETVKQIIEDIYYGEQPVGTCLLVPVPQNDPLVTGKYRYLAHVPTMRVPRDVSKTENAYVAFRALLREILNFNRVNGGGNRIRTVVMTPFCTGVGKMAPSQAAAQMRVAYDMTVGDNGCTWEDAHKTTERLLRIQE